MSKRFTVRILMVVFCLMLALPLAAFGGDKLVVKDSGGNTQFVVTEEGYVGIGTSTPSASGTRTEILSTTATNRGLYITQTSNDGNAAIFKIRKSRGSSAILSGDYIANYGFQGYDGTAYGDAARIRAFAAENWTSSAHGTNMILETVTNGTTTGLERMRIDNAGTVTINKLVGTYTNGSAYVCVNNAGQLFASETACP